MSAVRDVVRTEVQAHLEGLEDPKPQDVFALIQSYGTIDPGIGECDEGQEIEPALKDGERPSEPDDKEEAGSETELYVPDVVGDGDRDVASGPGPPAVDEPTPPPPPPPGLLKDLHTMEALLFAAESM